MSNQFSISRSTSNLPEQSAKLSFPSALTAQAAKMMLATNSLFNFAAAGASRIISTMSNGKYLDEKATTLFAQAKTDFAKAGAAGLVGFALSLVALVVLYKTLAPSKKDPQNKSDDELCKVNKTHNENENTQKIDPKKLCSFGRGAQIPYGVMQTLNHLFQASDYTPDGKGDINPVQRLPFTESFGLKPTRKWMTANIHTGIYIGHLRHFVEKEYPTEKNYSNGSPYIIFRVNCTITEEDCKRLKLTEDLPKILESEIVIGSITSDGLEWSQLNNIKGSLLPSFIDGVFTSSENGNVLPTAQADFNNLKTLIRTGEAKDKRGLTWKLPDNEIIPQ